MLWYPTQAPRHAGAGKTGLDPDLLPRCAREVRVCAFHQGKAHGVYQRHMPPQEIGAMGHPAVALGKGAQQVPRLPPDFLSGLVVLVDFMRLSSKKAAYVVVGESTVVGNPEFAPTARRGRQNQA